MKIFLIKAFLSFSVLLVFVFAYGSFCDYFFTQKQFLDLSEKKQWVLAQEGGSYDYAVLGSSRAFGAFDMNLLDSLTGMDGINIASDGSGFKDNYLILSHFLKSNSIKILFLQIDEASLNSKESFSNEFHAFRFLPYWKDEKVKTVLKEEIPLFKNSISDLFPQWRYFYFNKYFSPKEVVIRWLKKQIDRYRFIGGGKGRVERKFEIENFKGKKNGNQLSINEKDLFYLNEIVKISKEFNIQVVGFVAPTFQENHNLLKFEIDRFCFPIYFPDEFENDNINLFVDSGHLNYKGSSCFTLDFSKTINNYFQK